MKILKLTLYKQYFDAIKRGEKTEEYRLVKPFWEKRLSKNYSHIEFTNGYGNNRPKMVIEFLGVTKKKITIDLFQDSVEVFAIKLGRIILPKQLRKRY